jgi:hypothetical protein
VEKITAIIADGKNSAATLYAAAARVWSLPPYSVVEKLIADDPSEAAKQLHGWSKGLGAWPRPVAHIRWGWTENDPQLLVTTAASHREICACRTLTEIGFPGGSERAAAEVLHNLGDYKSNAEDDDERILVHTEEKCYRLGSDKIF